MLATVFLGGGPGGLGPLIWAAQQGTLPQWLAGGVAIIDRQPELGGTLGRYGINADSLGGSFLECLYSPALPEPIARLRDDPVTAELERYRDGFSPLALVDRFSRRLGRSIASLIDAHPASSFIGGAEALALRLRPDGSVTVTVRLPDGRQATLAARTAVVALGGRPRPPDRSLARCGIRVLMGSDHLLSRAGLSEAQETVARADGRPIVILGGSHSAYSAAWALLQLPAAGKLRAGQIVILQRRPPPVFYPDRASAEADLYDVAPGDVCPRTQRINRLGGLRGNGRELWRQIAKRPGTTLEPRVGVLPLAGLDAPRLRSLLKEAALVVTAFGYRAATIPMFDARGRRIALNADAGAASVDDRCHLLLANGAALPQVFGLGLGSGYRPTGAMGGEPNFAGQANSLWLYQNDIGAMIQRGIERALHTPEVARALPLGAAAPLPA
ncbi:MAG TPA: hypothetical protein VEC14_11055 [Reyranellaceae bacterium]|nr:hypothetical protein [Reyranellaceae bacterium]